MFKIKNRLCVALAVALCGGVLAFPHAVHADVFLPQAATPTFSPAGGVYDGTQTVTITSVTGGASIAYTTDGSIPAESGGIITRGTLYSGAVLITPPTTLSAIAFKKGYLDSGVCIEGYTLPAAAPAFSPMASDFPGTGLLPAVAIPTVNVLFNFSATGGGGIQPVANLVQGTDGNFYGTTSLGGSANNGSIFVMTPAGVLTTLVSFTGTAGANPGANPDAGLVQGSDGNFYGTANGGGSSSDGTVFKMTPAGVLTTLVTFTGPNGAFPDGVLVQGSDGNFYGTTYNGGSASQGTVFKLSVTGSVWTLTTLISFNVTNGADPEAGLIQGSDGNFYGTTAYGGVSNDGTVFKLSLVGGVWTLTNLVSFTGTTGANPGALPEAGLVQGSDGNFYGTTHLGGSSNDGTIFKITPTGTLTTLVTFNSTTGANPSAGLALDSYGNFYGTTSTGGTATDGTVFKLSSVGGVWTLTTLASFISTNGAFPDAGLVRGSDGNFYGTTLNGGTSVNDGVVFQLAIPLAAAPAFSPAAGTYTSAQTVTITSATSGALIAYTTDGSTPTESGGTVTHGTLYSGAISISASTTLNAIAFENGFTDSPVTSGTYTITVPAPAPAASGGGGGAPSYWFYLALAALAAARYAQTRRRALQT